MMTERESPSALQDRVELGKQEALGHITERLRNILYPTGETYLRSPQKRTLDVVGSLMIGVGGVATIPFVAAAIKLEDGGPIFFTHEVVGRDGQQFNLIKLRSMIPNAQEQRVELGEYNFRKLEDDPRITRVGEFIRRWTLDELPQFFNILRGEMSLVGPRPNFGKRIQYLGSIPRLQDLYPEWVTTYHLAKPGLAGLAAGRGRALLDLDEQGFRRRMRYDSFYVRHASLGFDIKLLSEAIAAVISRRGAF